MGKGEMELRCAVLFVFFEFMAVYVATAASINCSLTWKPDFHTDCHYYHQHLHEQQAGLPTSDGFVLKGRMLKKSHRISSSVDAHDKRDLQEGRMLKKSHRIPSSMDAHDKRDLQALLSFRNAITSDPTGSLSDWTMENSEKICSWKGIWCRRSTRRVVAIILPRLGLAGTLPPSLGNLSLLRSLDLSYNNFRGTIPPGLGKLKALGVLRFRSNLLQGSIPPEFGHLKKLIILDLGFNLLHGSIPKALGNCTRLQYIKLSVNNLTGIVPMEFGGLVNLERLYLSHNNLNGGIPASLSNCTSLRGLFIGFKCVDLDGNGVLTPNEMQFFYEEQLHRMECMAQEPVLFEDILCQMVDMIAPEKEWLFTLRDLKRCKLSGSVFNILFNLNKFMAFETRDPFLIRQEREDPTLTEWDRFAHKEYIRLSMEEDGENASNGSPEVWDESLEAPF